ncbi:MAG: HAD hydrolase family protein [Lachnospiraceae bacterium]|nr:HAD hydrolase family protein [Lachnospiraceae bacterium]
MKAIITDLDRTLLHTDKSISPYTLDVLKACHRAGIHILAATARPRRNVTGYHEQIRFDAMTVTNGAQIILPDREIVNGLSRESAEKILTGICKHPDIILSVETSIGFFASEEIPGWKPILYHDFPKLPAEADVYKMLVSSKHDSILSAVQNSLTEDAYFTVASGSLIQMMSRRATKWNGVEAMLEAFGISPEEAVYFGDDNDDIESIKRCGIGVAVANAIPEVLAVADVVVGSNDEDGVAKYIEEHLLK